ncbi:MAG: DUF2505 family protein [Pseudonocardiaceae bacterium]|nr:DUF2505 family protein [Pseudonocardiaceae bacterium]
MASRIEHRARFSEPPSVVYSALIAEAYLQARLAALGGTGALLLEHDITGVPATYHIRHGVPSDKLPSAARSLLGGDLIVDRRERWQADAGEYRNTIEAIIPGMPGEIQARMRLGRSADDDSELHTTGEVKIGVPVLGGKLERTIAEQVTALLIAEMDFTEKWLTTAR